MQLHEQTKIETTGNEERTNMSVNLTAIADSLKRQDEINAFRRMGRKSLVPYE